MNDYIEADMRITDCRYCKEQECVHRNCFRRLSVLEGGLGLCPRLLCRGKYLRKYEVRYTVFRRGEEFRLERSALVETEHQVKRLLRIRHRSGIVRIDLIKEVNLHD